MRGTVAFKPLGCKLNQYEIQALREGFLKHGFEEVPFSSAADYYVLNTCTVTEWADTEAGDLVKSCQRKNPSGQIIVTGCTATANPEKMRALPGVTMVVDNKSKNQILFKITGLPETTEEESPFFKDGISYFEDHSRAFIKVQDGCNYFCTFCKIPYVRGRLVSRAASLVLDEIRRLVDVGYEEIVLSGVCLGSYGKDFQDGTSLASLLREATALPGRFRLRLSSIDPRDTPVELARIMKESDKLSPHLHLSLQSGDDEILSRMKRGYTTTDYRRLVDAIRKEMPGIGFTTDLIVGFPGETDAHFENTARFLEAMEFHKVHIFPYSEREKTKAVQLEGKVPVETIRRREEALKNRLAPVTNRLLGRMVGQESEVLVEARRKDGLHEGFLGNYARCVFTAEENFRGSLRRFRPLSVSGEKLKGILV